MLSYTWSDFTCKATKIIQVGQDSHVPIGRWVVDLRHSQTFAWRSNPWGTKQKNDSFTGVRDEDTKHLINLGNKYFPDLRKTNAVTGAAYFDIERVNVGLRPARIGGLNTSVEFHDGCTVINNYGAGGMGYELSYGASLQVYQNLISVLNKSKL